MLDRRKRVDYAVLLEIEGYEALYLRNRHLFDAIVSSVELDDMRELALRVFAQLQRLKGGVSAD